MRIIISANTKQYTEILAKGIPDGVFLTDIVTARDIVDADAYFDLLFEEAGPAFPEITEKPVFVNAVIKTNKELPANYLRLNAWNGFLERELLELAETDTVFFAAGVKVLNTLGWKYQAIADIPGMIAARVIATIINEAYFALGDDVSTKAEIDTAMRLGTNYPYGPFEWSEKIGLQKIYALLKKLQEGDSRYMVAPALENEILISK